MAEPVVKKQANSGLVDETAYPRNSKTVSPTQKGELKTVVKGKVKQRKKTFFEKFKESTMEEDGRSIGEYLLFDFLLPALKDLAYDLITTSADRAFYGGTTQRSIKNRKGSYGGVNYVSYSSMSQPSNRQSRAKPSRGFDSSSILFDSRSDAEAVLSQMVDVIETYGAVSIADFYQSIDRIGEYTDNKYGWTDLRFAKIMRLREGYILDLPKPEFIG